VSETNDTGFQYVWCVESTWAYERTWDKRHCLHKRLTVESNVVRFQLCRQKLWSANGM
jgi:hypothetical protein